MTGWGGCISNDGKGCRGSANGRGSSSSGSGKGGGGSSGGTNSIGSSGRPMGAHSRIKASASRAREEYAAKLEEERREREAREELDRKMKEIYEIRRIEAERDRASKYRGSFVKTFRARITAENRKPPAPPAFPTDAAKLSAFINGDYRMFPHLTATPDFEFVSPLHLTKGLSETWSDLETSILETFMSPMPERFAFKGRAGTNEAIWRFHVPDFIGVGGEVKFDKALDANTSFYGAMYGCRAPLYQDLARLHSKPFEVTARDIIKSIRKGEMSADDFKDSDEFYYVDIGSVEKEIKSPSPKFSELMDNLVCLIADARDDRVGETWGRAIDGMNEFCSSLAAFSELARAFPGMVSESLAEAKAWLNDDGFREIGRQIHQELYPEGTTRSFRESWERVGERISGAILNNSGGSETKIKDVLRYQAVCWEKAKAEHTEMRCVEAFKSQATEQSSQLIYMVLSQMLTKGNFQQAAKSGGVYGFIKGLKDMLHDPRCDIGELERRVDECVTEMYNDARREDR